MLKDADLFETLYASISNDKIKLNADPIPQADVESFNALRKTVRVDTFAVDVNERRLSIDMQGRYDRKVIPCRLTYYAACMLANQHVNMMEYDKLKNVVVTFIMSNEHESQPVKRARLYYDIGKYELYNELITIYEVYVPSVVERKSDGDLYIFARFFSVDTEEKLVEFAEEFKDNKLAVRLAAGYSEVIVMGKYRTLSEVEEDTFWQKDIEEIRAISKEDGRLEGKLELAREMINLGYDVNVMSKLTGFDAGYITGNMART